MSLDTMKVLLVTLQLDRRGGLETYGVDLAHALQRAGCDVECVSALERSRARVEGVPRRGLVPAFWPERRYERHWQLGLRLHLAARRLYRSPPGLVIAAHPYTLPLVGPWAASQGIPHWGFLYGFEAWAEWSEDLSEGIRGCPTLVAVSDYTASSVASRLAGPEPPVNVLHPMVDTARFTPGAERPASEGSRLLTVSRLASADAYKGHELVMDCLPGLAAGLRRSVRYDIVGEGDDRSRLQAEAARRGLAESVHFHGRVGPEALVDLYRACDVFVMPSRVARRPGGGFTGEGFGIVYLEAAACGKPVVGLAQGGVVEAVAHGETGLLVENDAAALAAALGTLLSDGALRRRLGAAGRARVLREFSVDAFDTGVRALLAHTARAGVPR